MRRVVLDTETTGLEIGEGHRILEIGCVEIISRRLTRRHFHQYINPERDIDDGALEVHGITQTFLHDKPCFREVWPALREFIEGSEVIIHNAAFDLGFLNHEMKLLSSGLGVLTDYCRVVDSLDIARNKHPGQKNSLDALCKRYSVDNSQRRLHGALLDAEILADVYLLLTGGQVTLSLGDNEPRSRVGGLPAKIDADRPALRVVRASQDEIAEHERKLDQLDRKSKNGSVWRRVSL